MLQIIEHLFSFKMVPYISNLIFFVGMIDKKERTVIMIHTNRIIYKLATGFFLFSWFRCWQFCNVGGAHLREMLFHNCLQSGNTVRHVGIVPSYRVESGMNGLCSLFPKKTKSHLPLLQKWNNMIFHHV